MKYILERVSDPAIEPVSLQEMKRHLRCFDDVVSEDGDILGLISVAREWVEDYTGRALVDQTWRLTIDQTGTLIGDSVAGYSYIGPQAGFYSGRFIWASCVGEIMLRKAPVLAITSFVSVDSEGAETTIDASTYQLREADSKWPRLVPLSGATWSYSNLRVTFRAGFADQTGSPITGAEVIPRRFKQAIKLHAEAHYDRDPANMKMLLEAAEATIRPERSELGFA